MLLLSFSVPSIIIIIIMFLRASLFSGVGVQNSEKVNILRQGILLPVLLIKVNLNPETHYNTT